MITTTSSTLFLHRFNRIERTAQELVHHIFQLIHFIPKSQVILSSNAAGICWNFELDDEEVEEEEEHSYSLASRRSTLSHPSKNEFGGSLSKPRFGTPSEKKFDGGVGVRANRLLTRGRSDVERLKYEVGCGEEEREKGFREFGFVAKLGGKSCWKVVSGKISRV
ncbi:hypothetical protein Tco_0268410 [Tanacetum coccineum]